MTLHKFKILTKPFWVPAITAIYLSAARQINPLVLVSLGFCYIGDLLLIKNLKSWFVAGAVSFMIGHLFYIYVFLESAGGLKVFSSHPVFCAVALIPYVVYIILFRKLLSDNVSSIFLAAVIYISILLMMSYSSLLRIWNLPLDSFLMTFCGSILFLVSDTLISVRNFKRKFKGIGTIIVVTYIAAQLLIIGGLL